MINSINKIEIILASFYLTLYNLQLVYYIELSNCHESSTYMTSVGKGGVGGRGPSKRSRTSTFFSSRGHWSYHLKVKLL